VSWLLDDVVILCVLMLMVVIDLFNCSLMLWLVYYCCLCMKMVLCLVLLVRKFFDSGGCLYGWWGFVVSSVSWFL